MKLPPALRPGVSDRPTLMLVRGMANFAGAGSGTDLPFHLQTDARDLPRRRISPASGIPLPRKIV